MSTYRKIRFFGAVLVLSMSVTVPSFAELREVGTTGPEKGVLYIHGGGGFDPGEFVELARKAAGNRQPVIRVITTAQGKRRAAGFKQGTPFKLVSLLKKRYELENVTELYTLSAKVANQPEFFKQIDSADAVFMSGGNQCFLTDAFLETESMAALGRLLERGGVIGGASAGAQVQSSFMTRGDYTKRQILGDKKHQEGFGFVQNSVFDVHVEERDREKDLLQVFRAKKPQLQDQELDPLGLLGIGIDQGTSIIVTQNQFRVSGKGQVYLFDPRRWRKGAPKSWRYKILKSGTRFDMKLRKVIP